MMRYDDKIAIEIKNKLHIIIILHINIKPYFLYTKYDYKI